MTRASVDGSARSLIATSWRRLAMSGLFHRRRSTMERSRRSTAAADSIGCGDAVLDEMANELDGTAFAVGTCRPECVVDPIPLRAGPAAAQA